ncbi:class I SAM-dependent methyltransferase [Paenibacillus barcinonensis]|uniref:Class I SAM-dependent methyltransferase n=1 Tax=Paenibacillus barcinonensis TaxID=198119 RepID=A0A2V4VTG3_PAEBA|nr:methyltransferase domain-containing protein [Paenibacillus barcinonensis]PYE50080.1 methyltransferase family protein [Paenibacillus barcinonensis]QKS59820.1 class I SAM-dependent methyltransferase [Paenibacillus barcinonensis]
MSEYYWDQQIEYLRNTRWLYYNDDYLEFLVQRVWKIEKAVHIMDYGCGFGYMGLKLLPLLPEGSKYTGVDKGTELIKHAKEIYEHTSYRADFIEGDIETMQVDRAYDIAMSHAFLLHMPDADKQRLVHALKEEGLGAIPGNRPEVIAQLIGRGLTHEEANQQYEAEERFAREFNENVCMTYAPNMKITSGIVAR